jgi:hypothetical protein
MCVRLQAGTSGGFACEIIAPALSRTSTLVKTGADKEGNKLLRRASRNREMSRGGRAMATLSSNCTPGRRRRRGPLLLFALKICDSKIVPKKARKKVDDVHRPSVLRLCDSPAAFHAREEVKRQAFCAQADFNMRDSDVCFAAQAHLANDVKRDICCCLHS